MNNGVPQASVLGLLFFLIMHTYTNASNIKYGKSFIFADYTDEALLKKTRKH